jgi:hypothetical protein
MDENPYQPPNEVRGSEDSFDWFPRVNLLLFVLSAIFSIGVLIFAAVGALVGF